MASPGSTVQHQFASLFARLTGTQKALLGVVAVGAIAAIGALVFLVNTPNYATLFTNLSPEDASKIVDKLKEKDTKVLETCPALSMSRKWLQSIMEMDADGRHLGMMSYNTYRRIRRRYHTEVLGYEYAQTQEGWSYYKVGDKKGEQKEYFKAYQPLPSVMISELDFTPIGLPLAGLPAVEFEGADDEEDDDE